MPDTIRSHSSDSRQSKKCRSRTRSSTDRSLSRNRTRAKAKATESPTVWDTSRDNSRQTGWTAKEVRAIVPAVPAAAPAVAVFGDKIAIVEVVVEAVMEAVVETSVGAIVEVGSMKIAMIGKIPAVKAHGTGEQVAVHVAQRRCGRPWRTRLPPWASCDEFRPPARYAGPAGHRRRWRRNCSAANCFRPLGWPKPIRCGPWSPRRAQFRRWSSDRAMCCARFAAPARVGPRRR